MSVLTDRAHRFVWQELDARTDLFSFGAVLYEMATGTLPFHGETSAVISEGIMNRDPVPVLRMNPDVPAELERIINKCMEKDRNLRYQSAAEMRADLQRLKRDTESGKTATITKSTAPFHWSHKRIVAVILAIAAIVAVLTVGARFYLARPANRINSIAVLPLENLSRDPEQEYFADGMTEALITELSRINSLKVISRTSVMRYKAVSKPLPEIARELGVDGIIEGSVLRAGDRVRITTQLIYAPTDSHIWANSYDRDLRDILGLQTEVADAITVQVRAAVSREKARKMAAIRSVDPEAYNRYLQGRFWWNKRTAEAMNRASEYFTKTIEIDPSYAPAYAGLADTLMILSSYSVISSPELSARSEAMAHRAIELDASISESHTVLGALAEGRNDWSRAERELQQAIELDPNSATAHHRYATLLHLLGRDNAGFAEIRTAHQLDPMSMMIATLVGAFHRYQNRYVEAEVQLQEVLKMDANFASAHGFLMSVYEETGRFSKAIDEQEKFLMLFGKQDPDVIRRDEAMLRKALAESGARGYFIKSIELLNAEPARKIVLYTDPARYYLLIGEKEKALASLAAEDCRTEIFPEELRTPPYDTIRSDPRFQQVLRCKGLPL